VFLAGGTVLGLALCEVLVRLSPLSYPVFDTYDDVRGFALRPGKSGWYDKEGRAYVSVNHLGYRDEEHSQEKPAGVFRILFLGDSFTEARQIDLPDTFWKQVERNLNADERMAGKRVEVISCAVGGYSTTQELLTLHMHGLGFEPDLVVLCMYLGNDISGNSKRISQMYGLETFQPFHAYEGSRMVLDNSFRKLGLQYLKQRFMLTAIHYSRLLEVVNQLRRELQIRRIERISLREDFRIGARDEIYVPPRNQSWNEAWLITQDLLRMMREDVTRAGARFLVATLSTQEQVNPDADRRRDLLEKLQVADLFYSERRLREFGAENSIEVVTLAERMQAAAAETGVFFHGFEKTMGVGHWNKNGHTIAAEVLTEEILSRGLAP
jgi:hypothetical protein